MKIGDKDSHYITYTIGIGKDKKVFKSIGVVKYISKHNWYLAEFDLPGGKLRECFWKS